MLAVEPFVKPATGTREYNAIRKAADLRPEVVHLYDDDKDAFYLVKRRDKASKYIVRCWQDPDSQIFIECLCKAGFPPLLKETNLPAWDPSPCVHAAAVLLFISEKDQKETEDVTSTNNPTT